MASKETQHFLSDIRHPKWKNAVNFFSIFNCRSRRNFSANFGDTWKLTSNLWKRIAHFLTSTDCIKYSIFLFCPYNFQMEFSISDHCELRCQDQLASANVPLHYYYYACILHHVVILLEFVGFEYKLLSAGYSKKPFLILDVFKFRLVRI